MKRLASIVLAAGLALGITPKANEPTKFESMVASHVDEMLTQGYAKKIDETDLFHGHLVFRKKEDCYKNLSHALDSFDFILYHTDESLKRWESQKGEPKNKTQRSIVGFRDGTIRPAVDVMGEENIIAWSTYECCGTIYGWNFSMNTKESICVGDKALDITFLIDEHKNPLLKHN